jgi:hypothetical protein
VFENKVLRKICGPKRKEVKGWLRILRNEELQKLYSSHNITVKKSRLKMGGYVTSTSKMNSL